MYGIHFAVGSSTSATKYVSVIKSEFPKISSWLGNEKGQHFELVRRIKRLQ